MPKSKSVTFAKLFPAGTLRDRLRTRLTAEFNEPEGAVRCFWVKRLIHEYGFQEEQLEINVAAGAGRDAERTAVFADIVAYRDKRRREPFVVVETKRPEEKRGIKQAESYARNLGADYHVWTNGATDAPICQDSRSGSQVCGLARSVVCHHALKDLAGEKAFETADDLPFGPPFNGASFDVVEGW